ncbi:MAG: flagellar biosynthetic protein FliR [Burkholderiaceae bacterium]|jgi:flagellar biosynthetic protein FliR
MISLTEAQIMAWLAPVLWPFIRVLALFSSMPVLGQRNVPIRVRIALSFFIAIGVAGTVPAGSGNVALDSPAAILLVVQQVLIGLSLGFAVRIIFTAIEFAGEIIGLQMGLNFAGFFDPATAQQATATSSFFSTMVAFLFIAMNGHLLVIEAVVQSLVAFPVSPEPFAFLHAVRPETWGAEIFRLGLWIALPLIAMLLFVNMMLGIIARVAPQISIFSVGFPITLGVGLVGVMFTLPLLQGPFTTALEQMLTLFR